MLEFPAKELLQQHCKHTRARARTHTHAHALTHTPTHSVICFPSKVDLFSFRTITAKLFIQYWKVDVHVIIYMAEPAGRGGEGRGGQMEKGMQDRLKEGRVVGCTMCVFCTVAPPQLPIMLCCFHSKQHMLLSRLAAKVHDRAPASVQGVVCSSQYTLPTQPQIHTPPIPSLFTPPPIDDSKRLHQMNPFKQYMQTL